MSIKITIPNTSSDVLTFGSANTPTAAQIAGIDSGSSNGQLAFYTTASGTSTERVRVDASGNVGIGATPTSPFTGANSTGRLVVQQGTGNVNIALVNNTNDAYTYLVNDGTAFKIQNSYNSTAGQKPITFWASGAENVRIDTSGNLLVGTTTTPSTTGIGIGFQPGYSASGVSMVCRTNTASNNDHLYFYTTSGLAGYIRTNGITTTYVSVSDERLKENIADADSAVEKVQQIQVRKFDWKSGDGHVDYGFIAQELNLVAPQAVAEGTEENDVWAVDSSMLVPLLTKAIQEQQALITQLQADVAALKGTK